MREETGDIEPLLMRLANVPRVGGTTTSNDDGEVASGDWPAVLLLQTVGSSHQSTPVDNGCCGSRQHMFQTPQKNDKMGKAGFFSKLI